MKRVTVKDMLEMLQQLPPDCMFTVWLDGERLDIVDVDDSFIACNFVEFNVARKADN